MTSFDFPVSETVLLTGAGFTHNFGGFLAADMWDEIHNNFQRNNPNNEKGKIDKIVCSYKSRIINRTAEVDTYKLRRFFQRLNGQGRDCGFFFTVNQDILIEQYFSEGSTGPALPGIKA